MYYISNTVHSATVPECWLVVEGAAGPELQHHVVGQEVLPPYDHQEVVNTDPASDQHHGHHPHQGLVSPFRINISLQTHTTAETY